MSPSTRKEQIREILRCGKDPTHFIKTYCKIAHPKKGILPFKTYPFQDECIEAFVKHRFNIVLKSRQLGLSTVTAAYAVWLSLFYKEKNILVIATKLPTAVNFIKKVKIALKNLPSWLKITSYVETRQEIRFSNGSSIKAIPTSEDAGRSEALSLLIVDEAAFVRNFDVVWTGLYPTLSEGGSAIILSTPNGVGGQYYQLWAGAESGVNEFNPIKLPWNVHPEHDQAWFDRESKQISKRKVQQEFLCSFIGSGDTYVGADELAWLSSIVRNPVGHGDTTFRDISGFEQTLDDRDVWVWVPPVAGHEYLICADVSRGDSRDFSTFHVIDAQSTEVVADFRGKIAPDKFGILLNKYGYVYNKALICPESNTFGFMTGTKLKELKYPRLVYEDVPPAQADSYIPKPGDRVGFGTYAKSRDIALSKMEEMIRNHRLHVYSARTLNELRTFTWNGSKAAAMKDEFDDMVMSLAIGCWLYDSIYGVMATDIPTPRALLNAMSMSSTKFHQIPGNGNEVKPVQNHRMQAYSIYRRREHEFASNPNSFDWLLK